MNNDQQTYNELVKKVRDYALLKPTRAVNNLRKVGWKDKEIANYLKWKSPHLTRILGGVRMQSEIMLELSTEIKAYLLTHKAEPWMTQDILNIFNRKLEEKNCEIRVKSED